MATPRTTLNEAANANLEPTNQALASKKAIATAKASQNTASSQSHNAQSSAQSLEDTWVTLHNPPSDYSHHEALLLCEGTSGEWVSWVPGYGEIALTPSQFYAAG